MSVREKRGERARRWGERSSSSGRLSGGPGGGDIGAPGSSPEVAAALARVAAVGTTRLVTLGRKSGLPRPVTIWFVVDGPALGLGTLKEDRDWVRNARAHPEVELEIDGLRLRGRLRDIVDPAAHRRVRRLVARKYLPARVLSWFGVGQRFTFRVDELRIVGD